MFPTVTPDVGIILLLALGIALAPCLPMTVISHLSLHRATGWMVYGAACLGVVWTLTHALPVFPMGVALLYWWVWPPATWADRGWGGRELLPTVLVWTVLALLWATLSSLPPWVWRGLPWVWTGIAGVALFGVIWQWYRVGVDPPEYVKAHVVGRPWWHPYRPFHPGCAWFGQRSLAGAFFALVAPLAPTPLLFLPLLGILWTGSGIGLLAALAGLTWRWPWVGWVALGIIGVGAALARWKPKWLDYTPRGNSLDSIWQRITVLRVVLGSLGRRAWWPMGYGPLQMEQASTRWGALLGPDAIPLGQIHNDLLHHVFEYGLPGVASLAVLGWLVLPHLTLGDPWSAAWITGVLLSVGTMPFRLPSIGLLFWAISVGVTLR